MTTAQQSAKAEKLENIRSIAMDYFQARDDLEGIKQALIDAMVDANETVKASQQEMADACDLSGDNEEHKFHRTRVQQFLREAR